MDKNLVYLVQTNTTVGFLSQNLEKLNKIKKRPPNKKFLKVVVSFRDLPRVPNRFKKLIRKATDTKTYIIKNEAYRVITNKNHKEFLKKFKWMYSSSANESGKKFDKDFALESADVVVVDKRGFFESNPSEIYKISNYSIKRVR